MHQIRQVSFLHRSAQFLHSYWLNSDLCVVCNASVIESLVLVGITVLSVFTMGALKPRVPGCEADAEYHATLRDLSWRQVELLQDEVINLVCLKDKELQIEKSLSCFQ